MARMRDELIHAHFRVDYDIVWDTVKNKIPVLHQKILNFLLCSSHQYHSTL